MDRRTFIATMGAAAVAPALPVPTKPFIGLDFAPGPDETAVRMLQVQNGLLREVHRVTGIPRYRLGSDGRSVDTWQQQVDAGLSTVIKREGPRDA